MKGCETTKGHTDRMWSGFYLKYMSGDGLDIGYAGYVEDPEPILPNAIGVDLNYPGYDGKKLPFHSESKDFVFAGHVLEHVAYPHYAIREWFRVINRGGYLIIVVPHQYLYEQKMHPPSLYCEDHKRFYTPGTLLKEIEETLTPNSYRVVHLKDIDDGYTYNKYPGAGMNWWQERFEIECVLKKIRLPEWELAE